MKKALILTILILLPILGYSQDRFNPLDPLGPEFGKVQGPAINSRSLSPFEGEKIPENTIEFYPVSNNYGNSKKYSKKNSNRVKKSYDSNGANSNENLTPEEMAKAIGERFKKRVALNKDKNEYAKVYSYNTEPNENISAAVTTYDASSSSRFFNSPCADKIGFSPTWDLIDLEKRYCECENEINLKKFGKVIFGLIFILVVSIGIYYTFSSRKKV